MLVNIPFFIVNLFLFPQKHDRSIRYTPFFLLASGGRDGLRGQELLGEFDLGGGGQCQRHRMDRRKHRARTGFERIRKSTVHVIR